MFTAVMPSRWALHEAGLTLIEQLMIMFVIAALTAVALPIYKTFVNRPIINAAQQDLIRMAAALQTNSFENKLTLSATSGYVNVPASPSARTSGTVASDFAGWVPTQSDYFSYAYSIVSDSLNMRLNVRATSTNSSILPTSCTMIVGWTVMGGGSNFRSANASCGFTTW